MHTEKVTKQAVEGRTTPNGVEDAEATMNKTPSPAPTEGLPPAAIIGVLGAIRAFVATRLLQVGYTLGSISRYLREQREAKERFSPAWHRQQSRRRLVW